jgi:hypothetical protein
LRIYTNESLPGSTPAVTDQPFIKKSPFDVIEESKKTSSQKSVYPMKQGISKSQGNQSLDDSLKGFNRSVKSGKYIP